MPYVFEDEPINNRYVFEDDTKFTQDRYVFEDEEEPGIISKGLDTVSSIGRNTLPLIGKGFTSLPQAAAGLMDLAPQERLRRYTIKGVKKILPEGVSKYIPEPKTITEQIEPLIKPAEEYYEGKLSEGYKEHRKEVTDAEGVWNTIKAVWERPDVAAGTIVESLPASLIPGGVGTRLAGAGMLKTALGKAGIKAGTDAARAFAAKFFSNPKTIAKLTTIGGAIEGSISTGLMQSNLQRQGMTPEQAAPYSVGAGAITALVPILTTKIPGLNKLDAEALVASAGYGASSRQSLLDVGKKIALTSFKEGVLEELPQETQETIFENLALGKPWDEGLAQAGVLGAIAGAGQGGLMAVGGTALDYANRLIDVLDTKKPKAESKEEPEISDIQKKAIAKTKELNRELTEEEFEEIVNEVRNPSIKPVDLLKPATRGQQIRSDMEVRGTIPGISPIAGISAEESAQALEQGLPYSEGLEQGYKQTQRGQELLRRDLANQDPYLQDIAFRLITGENLDLRGLEPQDLRSLSYIVGEDVLNEPRQGELQPVPVRAERGLEATPPPQAVSETRQPVGLLPEEQRKLPAPEPGRLPPPPSDVGPSGPEQFGPARRGPVSEETRPAISMGVLAKGENPDDYTGNELRQIAKEQGLEIPKKMLKKTDMINFIKEGMTYDKEMQGRVQSDQREREESRRAVQEQGRGREKAPGSGTVFEKEKGDKLTLETPFGKVTGNSATAPSESLAKLRNIYSGAPKVYSQMDGPTRSDVLSNVIRVIQNPKIFNAVISDIPINVMDDFASLEGAPKDLLRNQPMFIEALSRNDSSPIVGSVVESIINSPTLGATKIMSKDPSTGRPVELFPTVRAGQPIIPKIPSVISHKIKSTTKKQQVKAKTDTQEEITIPEITNNTQAEEFARSATPEQLTEAKRLSDEYGKQAVSLMDDAVKAKRSGNNKRFLDLQKQSNEIQYKSQLLREAIEYKAEPVKEVEKPIGEAKPVEEVAETVVNKEELRQKYIKAVQKNYKSNAERNRVIQPLRQELLNNKIPLPTDEELYPTIKKEKIVKETAEDLDIARGEALKRQREAAKPSEAKPESVKEAEVEGGAKKEPWEMTWKEYIESPYANIIRSKYIMPGTSLNKNAQYYENAIKQALSEGKQVPEEVLKDYPDLKPKQEVKAEEEKTIHLRKPPKASNAKTFRGYVTAMGGINPNDPNWHGEIKDRVPLSVKNGKTGLMMDELLAQIKESKDWQGVIESEQDILDVLESGNVLTAGEQEKLDLKAQEEYYNNLKEELEEDGIETAEIEQAERSADDAFKKEMGEPEISDEELERIFGESKERETLTLTGEEKEKPWEELTDKERLARLRKEGAVKPKEHISKKAVYPDKAIKTGYKGKQSSIFDKEKGQTYDMFEDKDRPVFLMTGEEAIDPNTLSKDVLNSMSRTLKAKGYDIRGSEDVRHLLKKGSVFHNGEFTHPVWQEAYNKAIKTKTKKAGTLKKKSDYKNINWQRIKELGKTTDLREAGYIVSDGSLIDLSGKKEGGQSGTRSYDHREAGGTLGMQELMDYGYIRMDYNSGSIDIVKAPAPIQYAKITEIAKRHDGEIFIDLDDGLGEYNEDYYSKPDRSFNQSYKKGTSPNRIVNDIKKFYSGMMPSRPLFAQSLEAKGQGRPMRRENVQKLIDKVKKAYPNFGEIEILDNQNDIPDSLHRAAGHDPELFRSGKFKVFAYFDPRADKITVIANNFKSPGAVLSALIHESIGHRGIDNILTPYQRQRVHSMINKSYADTEFGKQIIKDYGLDLSKFDHQVIFGKEVIAHMAQTGENASLMDKIIAIVKSALRKLNIDLKISDAEIRTLLARSAKFARTGKGEATGTGISFQVEAWHGSPHKFDKFTTDRIGTGEGAQAFGWGLYFSDLKDIAKHYADTLGSSGSIDEQTLMINGKKIIPPDIDKYSEHTRPEFDRTFSNTIKGVLKNKTELKNHDLTYLIELIHDEMYIGTSFSDIKIIIKEEIISQALPEEALQIIDDNTFDMGRSLYKVTLHKGKEPREYTWLDWDKPIKDQSQKVQNILNAELSNWQKENGVSDKYMNMEYLNKNASSIYQLFAGKYGSKEASLMLLSKGIDGIRYPAGSLSGGTKSGAKNYVVFDENAITIDETVSFQMAGQKGEGTSFSVEKAGQKTSKDEGGADVTISDIKKQEYEVESELKKWLTDNIRLWHVIDGNVRAWTDDWLQKDRVPLEKQPELKFISDKLINLEKQRIDRLKSFQNKIKLSDYTEKDLNEVISYADMSKATGWYDFREKAENNKTEWILENSNGNREIKTFDSEKTANEYADKNQYQIIGPADKERIYFRVGPPPSNGKSYNSMTNKYESGVSVYITPQAGSFAGLDKKNWYYGNGRQIDTGGDDEPVVIITGKWKKFDKSNLIPNQPISPEGGERPSFMMEKSDITLDDITKNPHGEFTKESKLAKRTEADAIEAKLVEDFGDLVEYKTKKGFMKDQAEQAMSLLNSDYEKAKRIAMGEEKPPGDLMWASVFYAVEGRALIENDLDFLYDLGTMSATPKILSEFGQQVKAADRGAYDSPVTAMRDIEKDRKNKNKRQGKKVVSIEKVKELKKKLADAEERLKEYEGKTEDETIEGKIDNLIDKSPKKLYKKTNSKILKEKIKLSIDQGNDYSDISIDIQELAKYFITQGITERDALVKEVHNVIKGIIPGITLRETMDAISGYGKFKPLSKDEVLVKLRDLKGQMQQVAKLQDMQAGRAPLKTGIERRTPTDEERRLIKQVEEMKKELGIKAIDPEKQLKSALDAVKTRLSNQIKDLEYQIETRQKIVKTKTGLTYDAEAKRLQKQRDDLKKQFDDIFGKTEITDDQRINMAIKVVEKSIVEYTRRINENDLTPAAKRTPVQSEQLNKLREERDSLKAKVKELRDLAKPKRTPEEIALQRLKTRLTNESKKLTDKLEKLDLQKSGKRTTILDAEGRKLKADRDTLKATFDAAVNASGVVTREEADRLIELSKAMSDARKEMETGGDRFKYGAAKVAFLRYIDFLKGSDRTIKTMLKDEWSEVKTAWKENRASAFTKSAMDIIRTISDLSISLMATLDNSFLGRQGLNTLLTHPTVWVPAAKKSFVDIYKTMISKHGGQLVRDAVMADAYSRLNYVNGDYDTAKLIPKSEEQFPTSIPERIPFMGRAFKASENAFLNSGVRMRIDTYDMLKKIAEMQGVDTGNKEWVKETGKLINSITARGDLGKMGSGGPLRLIFWAPKMLWGNVNVLTAHFGGAGLKTSFARQQARLNLLKIVGLTVLVAAIADGLGELFGKKDVVEWNPLSSDFMKIKINDTRYDLTAGKGSIITLLARAATFKTKSTTTRKITDLNSGKYGSKTLFDVIIDFMANKSAPVTRTAIDITRGRNFYYEKPTISNTAYNLGTPIGVQNFIETYQRAEGDFENMPVEEIIGDIVDMVGVNASTYESRAEMRKKYRNLRKKAND